MTADRPAGGPPVLPTRDQFAFWIPMTVRWGDMDSLGHVNNAKYFTYLESARTAFFDAVNLWRFQEHPRQGIAVVQAACNFRVQLRYPAELEVGLRVTRIGERSFTLEYGIFRKGTDEVVGDGSSVAVWMDFDASRALPITPEMRRVLEGYRGPAS
ncbi:MAG: acyl-CoA thioesterase [Candidatus Methylomirabilales bacterium]